MVFDIANRAGQKNDLTNLNLGARPESSSFDDYDQIPVHGFGMAMLRDMGFKKDEGIGKTFKHTFKPLEVNLRPKGLGLGAVPIGSAGRDKNSDDSEHLFDPKKGDYVQVLNGPHKSTVGEMIGTDSDCSRILIKSFDDGSVVSVSLNSLCALKDKPLQSVHQSKPENVTTPDWETKKKNNEQQFAETENHHDQNHHDIKVRIIDKKLQKGLYYKEKVQIVDVTTPFTCNCQTDKGLLLENLKQKILETVIPK